ncbi:MAG TPA: hypothetical protein VIG91_00035 [Terriglobales bacterium]|jgi:hypothetical protein
MKTARWATQILYSMTVLAVATSCIPQSQAQNSQSTVHHQMVSSQSSQAGALLNIVRQSTARFKDVSVAEAEGYSLQFGCVSGPDSGAMGLHFVNGAIVASGVLDATRPQIVIYEPQPDGRLKLIGADYLLIASTWDASHSGPPELMGQLFHYFETPNRFGLPAFYTLHVWAWKDNPNGAFVNWHPNVSCQSFGGN